MPKIEYEEKVSNGVTDLIKRAIRFGEKKICFTDMSKDLKKLFNFKTKPFDEFKLIVYLLIKNHFYLNLENIF